MPLKRVVRKHSAKCASFKCFDGDIRHYVFIGGRWYYSGRKDLQLGEEQAAKDGFWTDSIVETLTRGSAALSFKAMVHRVQNYYNEGKKPSVQYYIRHWESVREEGVPF